MNFKVSKNAVIIIIILLLIILVSTLIHYFTTIFNEDQGDEIHFLIFLATVALALIAYSEFDRSNKLTSNEFLLFIANTWVRKEIVKARQILHQLFIKQYRDGNGKNKTEYNLALLETSKDVLNMSRKLGKEGDDFIYLLTLLDYLETLSYFVNREDLTLKDIQNVCGNNLVFFYEVFKLFIEQRQKHNKSFYINFTSLYLAMNHPTKSN